MSDTRFKIISKIIDSPENAADSFIALQKEFTKAQQEIAQLNKVVEAAKILINGWGCPEDQGDQFDYDWLNLDKAIAELKE